MSSWRPVVDGFPRNVGSEGGVVRLDDEHPDGARITLEEGGSAAPWAITCGIYGWMVHTAFFGSEDAAREAFVTMKLRLVAIMVAGHESEDGNALLERFVADF